MSIIGVLKFRYILYRNKANFPLSDSFWKSNYPWGMICIFPSIFICGFKNDNAFYGLRDSIALGIFGASIGVSLSDDNDFRDIGLVIPGTGLGLVISKIILCLIGKIDDFQHPTVDMLYLGLVLLSFGFIIEDIKLLREKIESTTPEDYYDIVSSSIPFYMDMIFLYLSVSQFTEPFYSIQ